MSEKNITLEYADEVRAKIERGEKPAKINELSHRQFVELMLPHVKSFLAQDYTYKEIACFLGKVSAGDLKKAVEKDLYKPGAGKKTEKSAQKVTLTMKKGKKIQKYNAINEPDD